MAEKKDKATSKQASDTAREAAEEINQPETETSVETQSGEIESETAETTTNEDAEAGLNEEDAPDAEAEGVDAEGTEADVDAQESMESDAGDSDEDEKKVKVVTKAGTQTTSVELLAQKIGSQLADAEATDVVTLRFRVQTLLIIIGVALITMWLIPLGKWGITALSQEDIDIRESLQSAKQALPFIGENAPPVPTELPAAETNTATESASPEKQLLSIRLRNTSGFSEAGETMQQVLTEAGYETVELVHDEASEFEGIQVVTKQGQEDVRAMVEADLLAHYTLASSSATLTQDSDFDVVIILGTD